MSLAVLLVCLAPAAWPYSVLSHEAVVDALWDSRIKPILLAKFPGSTPAQLKEAHAYAYGGAIVQDMGYYPFGNKFFSDLTHYVRSGDFVTNLIADSGSLDDFAFSIGALSHYVSDCNGHPLGTNKAVSLLYPKLRNRFGAVITYEDDPIAHIQTEFGFDVLEVAKGRFAPAAYHDFIGFEVATPLLTKAFHDTYSLELKDVFYDLNLSVGSYRRAISQTIPAATKVAWAQRKDEIEKSQPGITRKHFLYLVSRSSYRKEFGVVYEGPSAWDKILAFILKLVPKIGPLRVLRFHMPTPEAEHLFMASFDTSIARFNTYLDAVKRSNLTLPDANFDTGKLVEPAAYELADKTYAKLIRQLSKKDFAGLDQATRSQILLYYKDLNLQFATKKNKKDWRRLLAELQKLEAKPPDAVRQSTASTPVRAK